MVYVIIVAKLRGLLGEKMIFILPESLCLQTICLYNLPVLVRGTAVCYNLNKVAVEQINNYTDAHSEMPSYQGSDNRHKGCSQVNLSLLTMHNRLPGTFFERSQTHN